MNKMIPTALLLVSSAFSGAAFANFTAIECNDCSSAAAQQQAAKVLAKQDNKPVYVVDFVNYQVSKYQQEGEAVTAKAMTLSENLLINNHYSYRKSTLRSAN